MQGNFVQTFPRETLRKNGRHGIYTSIMYSSKENREISLIINEELMLFNFW